MAAPAAPRTVAPRRRRPLAWLAVSLIAVVACCVLSVGFGARAVGIGDIVRALADPAAGGIAEAAVRERVPRTVLAVLVGAALAMSGVMLQGVTRNPLADPGILGINTGAALAVVVTMLVLGGSGLPIIMTAAMLGAAGASLAVYLIGSAGRGGATPLKLALAGAAVTAALSSLISAILLPRVELMSTFRFWQIGGVGLATWPAVGALSVLLVAGTVLAFLSAGSLNSLALGDDLAEGLGENVARTRLLAWVAAVVLCGSATAVAGPIGFVGLVVPHVVRLLVGVDHRWLLPVSAAVGACLLTVSDVIGRLVARPQELEVGIVTAVVGAPFFIWIVRRQKVRML